MPSFACVFVCSLPLIHPVRRLDLLVVLLLIWEPVKPLFLSQIPFNFQCIEFFFFFFKSFTRILQLQGALLFTMGSRPLVVFARIWLVGVGICKTEHRLTHRSCSEIALLCILGWEPIFCRFVADFHAFFFTAVLTCTNYFGWECF